MNNPKICPLLLTVDPAHMAKCRQDGCAWFCIRVDPENGSAVGKCALVRIANALTKEDED